MEIKIQCGCGVKFAFEVEPVQGRMPVALACPRCGADQTAQANQQIALKLAPAPLPDGRRGLKILNLPGYNIDPPPVPIAIPVAALRGDTTPLAIPIGDHSATTAAAPVAAALPPGMPPAPEAPAAPSVGGLKVNKTKKAESHAPPPVPSTTAEPVEESAAPRKTYTPLPAPVYDDEPPKGILGWLKVSGKAVAGTAVGFLVVLKFLIKTPFLAKLIAVIFGTVAASKSSEALNLDWNFKYDNATQIYVKADDNKKVVDACNVYWQSQSKPLKVEASGLHSVMENHYLVTPPHQGYVAIVGSFNWSTNFVDGLSKDLSTQLNTTTIMFMEKEDFKKGGHRFAVFQSGQKQFSYNYAMWMAGQEIKDSFQVEGEDWVKQNGYFKPGKEGFAEFDTLHANLISHKLGLHWYDAPDQTSGYHDLSD